MESLAEEKKIEQEEKYLAFILGNKIYGIEILRVREIIGLMDVTTVPQTPGYMKGVINLRGKVIPVIDLRLKFSMQEEEHTEETCIIVVEVHSTSIGIIVDSVSEVLEITRGKIEEAPRFGQSIDTNFITGLGKVKEKLVILLNIEEILSSEDLEMAKQIEE